MWFGPSGAVQYVFNLIESLYSKNVPKILIFQKEINQNIPGRNLIFFFFSKKYGKTYN